MSETHTSNNDTELSPTILTVKSLDPKSGIVRISDPMSTLHSTRVPFAFASIAKIEAHVSPNPSVYILVGPPDDDEHECRVYVGETGNGAKRISAHFGRKEKGWDVGFIVSSDNLAINTTHVRQFEYILYKITSRHSKMQLDNVEIPRSFSMAAYDRSLVERSLPLVIQLLISGGFPMAKLSLLEDKKGGGDVNPPTNTDGDGLYVFKPGPTCRFSGLFGVARRDGDAFILLPGSEVRHVASKWLQGSRKERQRVIDEGGLEPHAKFNDRKVMTQPVRCSNWKTAASALSGACVLNSDYWVPVSNLNEAGVPAELENAS